MSVLVNGSPIKEFIMNRGLRQGHPISPLLFNIVVEIFYLLLVKVEYLGLVAGIRLGNGLVLSHLQFADDTILIQPNQKKGLDWF